MTAQPELEPLPRCCDSHDDWTTLTQHLVKGFPDVSADDVVRELLRARSAVEEFGLIGTESLSVAELMVRHQLMLLNGEIPDIARLDPERHVRRGRTA